MPILVYNRLVHKPIKAIVFDADGVIIKKNYFSDRYLKDYGVGKEKTAAYFDNDHDEVVIGKQDFKKALKKYLKDWGWKGTVNELVEYWLTGETETIPEMMEIIALLKAKGHKVYLATNQVKERTEYFLTELNFNELFEKVYSSSSIGHKKPSREFFEHMIKDLKVKPEEIFFIDDDANNVAGARDLGIEAWVYTDHRKLSNMLKDVVL